MGHADAVLDGVDVDDLIDIHVHFMPANVLHKVWGYFDRAQERGLGRPWPIRYRTGEDERLATLRAQGVRSFAPLAYAHRPGMARWLTEWLAEFAARTPDAVPTATIFPEADVLDYLGAALDDGARCVKVHVQVGGFDPRDDALDGAWGLLAEAGTAVVVHCGDGPYPGRHTGLGIFESVLRRHPRLTAVIAHAGLHDYEGALDLAARYPRVHLDTTMVGTAFTQDLAPLPADWTARLADVADRVAFGSDFPNIPYPYGEQITAVKAWAAEDARLGDAFVRAVLHDTPARLLRLDGAGPVSG
jgi:predicted TIM-barrel fold metal-dependent hydrolase